MRLTCLLLFLILTACLGAPSARAQELKLGTLAPAGSPWHDVLVDIAQAWKEASGGRVAIRIMPNAGGDDTDLIRKMRVGQLQMAALAGNGLIQIAPEIQALQMPMMLTSYDELDYVRDRMVAKLEAAVEERGFKILTWAEAGFIRGFATRPIVRPTDLRALKLFTSEGDPVYADVMKRMGFVPVPMAVTDIFTGLQSGLIHAVPTPPIAALSFQWFGIANHMSDFRWAPFLGGVLVTRAGWQTVPADLRPRLARAAADVALRARPRIRQMEDQAIAAMKARGLMVHAIPADALAEWDRVARESYPLLAGKAVPASLLAEALRLRDEFRARGGTR